MSCARRCFALILVCFFLTPAAVHALDRGSFLVDCGASMGTKGPLAYLVACKYAPLAGTAVELFVSAFLATHVSLR
jgi:hypothetical protein